VVRYSHNTQQPGETVTSSWRAESNKRWQICFVSIVFLFLIFLVINRLLVHSDEGPGIGDDAFQSPLLIWKYPPGGEASLARSPSTPGDLLTNGDMDQLGFYWRYPNHWIPGGWFEWFSMNHRIPEFNNGNERNFVHSLPSSQRLQLWGGEYVGGLMQSVTVTPCTYHQLTAYGQSRPGTGRLPLVPVESHMRVGIEPYSWLSNRSITNYNPILEPEDFPSTVVWSSEATSNYVFTPYTVTTEALSRTITVILYSNPQVDLLNGVWWNDTVWDTASLVKVSPPSDLLLDDNLRERDGLIFNLSTVLFPRVAVVEWDTLVPASTQLIYRVLSRPDPISATRPLPHTLYLPQVTMPANLDVFTQHSPIEPTPKSHHRVTITGLPDVYTLEFVALSRRLEEKACVTSASRITRLRSPDGGYVLHIPVVIGQE
jgi:hypothetical protein